MKYSTKYTSTKYYVGARFMTNDYGVCEILGKVFRKGQDPHYVVEFLDTGYRTQTEGSNISRGAVKDWFAPTIAGIGYLGVGPFRSGSKGKITKEYSLWSNMIIRCYGDMPKWASYKGVEVCERWKCFQDFCEDLPKIPNYSKWLKGGYCLDKDISNSNLYSLETCTFITNRESSLEMNARHIQTISKRDNLGRIVNSTTVKK